jgi:GNAT superfamily N-acetyltransferase
LEGTGLVAMILISVAAGFLRPAFQHRSPTLTRSSLAATCQRNPVDRKRVAMAMTAAKGTTITRTSDHVLVIYADDDEVTSHDEAVKRDDEMKEEEESLQDKDEELLRLRRAAVAAALLKSGAKAKVPAAGGKPTSVGSRRLGSASKARNGASKTSQVVAGLRLVASISSVPKPTTNSTSSKASSPKVQLESTKIQATIDNLLSKQQVPEPIINSDVDVDLFKRPRRMGVLGEPVEAIPHRLLQYPMPGTILVHPTSSLAVGGITKDTITVRVATMADDADVANLRLSVFSDFSLEVRKQFCARSIQALSNRRLRGATSLVASIPAGGKKKDGRTDVVLGSVEASIHEFFGTDLGKRTKEDSILYITEVAVTPSARRCGIGSKLLEVRLNVESQFREG